ncbi:MAG: Alkaline phosphatase [Rariglobus sp.]|jgi:alkaline phosphatase|nr:Alkaline phosphatase [Rariglobus sp.]
MNTSTIPDSEVARESVRSRYGMIVKGDDGFAFARNGGRRRMARMKCILLFVLCGSVSVNAAATGGPREGNVILIHPDGSSLAAWNAFRIASVGPDGFTNWDRLPGVALYRSHFSDGLSPTSHGGATVHAWGVKVPADSYGTDGGKPLVARSGKALPILAEALADGRAAGYVQSGHLAEPGTGVFLASHPTRRDFPGIAAKIVTSGADVMLAGGEIYLLPKGVRGRHGEDGVREDGRDLIVEARAAGYAVVFSKEELRAAMNDRAVKKLLGVFAARATYNEGSEEKLVAEKLPAYRPEAPTAAEMTEAALAVLSRTGRRFALVIEEEGTDDFANAQNASALFEAFRRADQAIGVARAFLERSPETLLFTAADSDASGLQVIGRGVQASADEVPPPVPAQTKLGNPIDGVAGQGTAAFLSGPDRTGRRFWFGVTFSSPYDMVGGVVVRADGLNRERLPVNFDNTDVYTMMWETLFGRELPAR